MKLGNRSSDNVRSAGQVKILLPTGRLDAPSSEELKGVIEGIIGEGFRKIVVNFDSVEYISSSGLRVMLASLKQLRKMDGDLKLSSLKPYVRETFEIAGFTQLFEIYDGEEEAVAEFDR